MTSMTSVSLEEKRLKQLKQQLFGKEAPTSYQTTDRRSRSSKNTPDNLTDTPATALISDKILLKNDLMKIATLSALALLIQFSLYFAIQQGLINLF